MPLLSNLLLATAVLVAGTSAKPMGEASILALPVSVDCQTPVGNCTHYDGFFGCEFCCFDYTPPPGSICHVDKLQSGGCGEGNQGTIWHCDDEHKD